MKLRNLLLAAGLTAALGPGLACAEEYHYMSTAGELRGLIDQGRGDLARAYVFGVMDSMMRTRDFCVPDGELGKDIGDRALTLFAQQPRESKAPATDVIGVYLHSNYPCKT